MDDYYHSSTKEVLLHDLSRSGFSVVNDGSITDDEYYQIMQSEVAVTREDGSERNELFSDQDEALAFRIG